MHALEVLKGDRSRGTTWPLVTENGTRFDVLPDFRFAMHHEVERRDGGFRITGTEESAFRKIETQISAVADFASSYTDVPNYNFVPPVSTRSPGLHGILKTALHFVAAVAPDSDRIRSVCRNFAGTVFSDGEPANVEVSPYGVTDAIADVNRHQIIAWFREMRRWSKSTFSTS